MCFVFIWEQTATCATYSINWLVFITEMKSVYCAVRTGSLNKAVCMTVQDEKHNYYSTLPFKINKITYFPPKERKTILKYLGVLYTFYTNCVTTDSTLEFNVNPASNRNICQFSDALEKLGKSTVTFVTSLRPSAWGQRGCQWTHFYGILCEYFSKIHREISSFINIWQQ
jgi:hypothetical protein